jgi:hypothetical protein
MRIGESSRFRGEINELAVDLTYKAAELKASLPKGIQDALRELVRNMNCYYSNLIEGHHTHPIAIEKALNEVYDTDPKKRNLQLEAKAHIAVQRWIDEGNLPAARKGLLLGSQANLMLLACLLPTLHGLRYA